MDKSKPASAGQVHTPAASQFLTDRRAMLVGLPALGLGAGLAINAAGTDTSAGSEVETNRHEPHYSETQHIRTYYAVARR